MPDNIKINIPANRSIIDPLKRSKPKEFFQGFFSYSKNRYRIISQDKENFTVEKIQKKNFCCERSLKIAFLITPLLFIGLGFLIFNAVTRKKHHYALQKPSESISKVTKQIQPQPEVVNEKEKEVVVALSTTPTPEEITTPKVEPKKVNTHVYFIPKVLDFFFVTKVKVTDLETKALQEISLGIIHSGKTMYGNDVYYLVPKELSDELKISEITQEDAKDLLNMFPSVSLGIIQLSQSDDSIKIADMKTNKHKQSEGVGKALHEFAIRYSFSKGLEGKVVLNASWGSDGFHYKHGGYRYVHSKYPVGYVQYEMTYSEMIQFRNLCEKRLAIKDASISIDDLESEIINHKGYAHLQKNAEENLKRKPNDVTEAINYGLEVFWDTNRILDKFYLHPEENIKSPFCNPKNKRFKFDADMYLCDEKRAEWKKIIEI